LTDLLEATEDPDTLRKVLDSMDRTRKGRRLLRKLKKSLADGELEDNSAVSADNLKDFWQ